MRRFLPRLVTALGAVLAGLLAAGPARAEPTSHVTDGMFTSSQEWSGPGVTKTFFPKASDGSGGAYLYVEQGFSTPPAAVAQQIIGKTVNNTLFLMYDYVGSDSGLTQANSFFDVFFQVAPENTDYLVRILNQGNPNGSFLAFEKPASQPSSINPDGTFNTGAPWTPLGSDDLALANFQVGIGYGSSPDDPNNHLMAEFQLSINTASSGGTPNGLYDPDPAFWSASADPKTGSDPPISSGIFTLNPNGTTTVTPVLGPNGGPVKQGNVVPEPSSLLLLGLGFGGLGLGALRRRRAGGR